MAKKEDVIRLLENTIDGIKNNPNDEFVLGVVVPNEEELMLITCHEDVDRMQVALAVMPVVAMAVTLDANAPGGEGRN